MYPHGRNLADVSAINRNADMKSARHLLRYMRGTMDMATVHRQTSDWKRIRGSTDSDCAGCQETRKSMRCGVMRRCGVVISSHARTESVLAQSSSQAEYIGAVRLASEMLHVKELVKFMGCDGLTSFRHFCHLSCVVLLCCERLS